MDLTFELFFRALFLLQIVLCQEVFPNKTTLKKTMVCHLLRKFCKTSSVSNQKQNHSPMVLSDNMLGDMRLGLLAVPI